MKQNCAEQGGKTSHPSGIEESIPSDTLESSTARLFREAAFSGIRGSGLPNVEIPASPRPLNPKFLIAAHAAIYIPSESTWLDIVVISDRESATRSFEALTGMPVDDVSDGKDVLREMSNLIRGMIKRSLLAKDSESHFIGNPKAIPDGNIKAILAHKGRRCLIPFSSDSIRIDVLFEKQTHTSKRCSLGLLREGDTTLEPLFQTTNQPIPLLAKGVTLETRTIKKLQARFLNEVVLREMSVVSPPALYQLFRTPE